MKKYLLSKCFFLLLVLTVLPDPAWAMRISATKDKQILGSKRTVTSFGGHFSFVILRGTAIFEDSTEQTAEGIWVIYLANKLLVQALFLNPSTAYELFISRNYITHVSDLNPHLESIIGADAALAAKLVEFINSPLSPNVSIPKTPAAVLGRLRNLQWKEKWLVEYGIRKAVETAKENARSQIEWTIAQ